MCDTSGGKGSPHPLALGGGVGVGVASGVGAGVGEGTGVAEGLGLGVLATGMDGIATVTTPDAGVFVGWVGNSSVIV